MTNLTKNVGTVTLTGTAEKVTLPASYGWVWVKNMSEGDIFAGLSEDISEGADGVMVIPSGECGRIQADGFRSVWLLGTGNALVIAQNYADCPFKSGGKGGENGGGSALEAITEFPENPTDNKPYLFRNSDIGDIIVVHYDNVWHFSSLSQYPFEHMLYASDIYSRGQVIETPSEAVSVIDRTKEFSDKTFTSAVKIYGMGNDSKSFIFDTSIDFRSASTAKIYAGISAESADRCTIYLNGDVVKTIESTSTSETSVEDIFEISITPTVGVNTLKFSYNKDSSVAYGEDAVFIYGVRFVTG